jgi:polyisoprenoid-binding protein YceI
MKKIIYLILLLNGLLAATEYQVNKDQNNMVKFISDAPIEDFEGITDKIDGFIYWENDDMTKKSSLYFEVDLNTLDTGIGLRNRHMRENYLETEKYPVTYYEGSLTSVVEESGGNFILESEGKIFIHGIEKDLNVKGKMIATDNGYNIKVKFNVKLSDFNIEIPSIMFYKIDENMDLYLDFHIYKIEKE